MARLLPSLAGLSLPLCGEGGSTSRHINKLTGACDVHAAEMFTLYGKRSRSLGELTRGFYIAVYWTLFPRKLCTLVRVREQNSSAFVVESWWVSAGSLFWLDCVLTIYLITPVQLGPLGGLIVEAQDPPRSLWTLSLVPGLYWTWSSPIPWSRLDHGLDWTWSRLESWTWSSLVTGLVWTWSKLDLV